MSTFFISDLHFGHKNILTFDNRQFRNIEEHDEHIIECWNKTVTNDDDVWILGDISFYDREKTFNVINKLNGNKYLCVGNHDKHFIGDKNIRMLFNDIVDYKEIIWYDGKKENGVVLCHYPIPCFKNHYYGWYHLYGHVHNSFEYNMMQSVKYQMKELYDKPCNMYNVGCMLPEINYTPRTLEEIIEAYNR